MSDSFTHDVFLSHNSKDKPRVRGLAERLKQAGLQVRLDESEIRPGDSIPPNVGEAREHSRLLPLFLSTNGFGPDSAQLESGTFRFQDPLNKARRFLPGHLDDSSHIRFTQH